MKILKDKTNPLRPEMSELSGIVPCDILPLDKNIPRGWFVHRSNEMKHRGLPAP